MTEKYTLQPEHKARFSEWRDWWIANAFSCEQMTDDDRAACAAAVRGMYAAANRAAPRVVFAQSPFTAAIAAGVAAGVWYLREHNFPGVGRVTERELRAAIPVACAAIVGAGRALLFRGPAITYATRTATADATDAATRTATRTATYAATYAATDAATDDATSAATADATDAATRVATADATRTATYDATAAATDAATAAATRSATRTATAAATAAATYAATDDATSAATASATADATDAATYAATAAATASATASATRTATYAATGAATADATADATDDATDAATRAATDAATYAATRAATAAATDAATTDATYDATYAATADATDAATRSATADATRAATRTATADATDDATDAATRAATDAATYAATRSATAAATRSATYAATRSATADATRAATDAATRAATAAATDAATTDATYDATYAATADATDAATRSATADATRAATRTATADALVRFLAGCAAQSWRLRSGGNMWSGWASYLSFFRHVAKLPLDYTNWDYWETLVTRSGQRYVHARFCIVSDRPVRIEHDGPSPHCATRASHEWRDGWKIWTWRGTRVPGEWIENPRGVDPRVALTWENVEQRTAAAQILGWERILATLSPRVINTDPNPYFGELLEVDLPDAPGARFLRAKCGTGRTIVVGVPRNAKTAVEAGAMSYRMTVDEYLALEERT